ncbi:helicase SRCAP [Protopterus annectens]|nr:helicase SRCAP [Protopterus annectens]
MTGSSLILPVPSVSSCARDSLLHYNLLASDDSSDSFKSGGGPMLPSTLLPVLGTSMAVEYEQQDLLARGQKWEMPNTEIAEQAKHEAKIENRIAELRKDGLWSLKRLSKVPEPVRPKIHWDYLCEEMQWLAADFAQERRWKRGVARKVVRMVLRHHEEQRQKGERAKREEQAKLKRMAASIAKEVRQFWSNVEKVVQFKQQSRLEEKRKKALDLQLDFIVGQTEKYSDLLSQSLNETKPKPGSSYIGSSHADSATSSPPASITEDEDIDFEPHEEEDDEETIEVEEQQEGNDAETRRQEIEMLKRDSELPIEQLLESLPPEILEDSGSGGGLCETEDEEEDDYSESDADEEISKAPAKRTKGPLSWAEEEDEEFTADEDGEDVEETIQEEELLEGETDHTAELEELAKEGNLSVEALMEKYAGAYQEDFKFEGTSDSSNSEDEEEKEASSSEEKEDSESSESLAEDQNEEDQNSEAEIGMEYLLGHTKDEGEHSNDSALTGGRKEEITDIAAAAESLQPKGYTLATTQVKTPIPFLLRGTLREYQHIGLDWLVTMYEKKLNGILADEMGLGKTIQTISLLAHLACEKGNWGPHLIIVPTSVMLNWEMEFKRWCPGFKILTYYGTQKERKLKRQGWTKPNAFHVCITSYKLVLQDHQAFRRKNWKYLILDEAQNIKNFKSQRWQSLLNFNSQRRLLLTGTPLQNSLMELWSLMHFLMPHVFQSHREFKEWFSNPLTGMIEGSQEYNENLIKRLHKVLRPFLLRRIKVDVEKQMPKKYEHIIRCRLSKRQRYLYDDFMSQTHVDLNIFNLVNLEYHVSRYEAEIFLPKRKVSRKLIEEISEAMDPPPRPKPVKMKVNRMFQPVQKPDGRTVVLVNSPRGSAAAGVPQQQASSNEPSDTMHVLQPATSPHMLGPAQSASPVQPAASVQVATSVQPAASVHMAASVQSSAPVQPLASVHLAAPVPSAVTVQSPAQLHLTAPVHIAAPLQTGSSLHVAAPVQSVASVHVTTPVQPTTPIQPSGVGLHAPVSQQVAMPTTAVVAGSVTAATPAISQPPSVYHQISAVRPPTVMVHPALGQTTMPVLSSPVSALPVLQAQVPLSPAAVIANVPRPPPLTSAVSSTMKPATIPATTVRMSAAALAPGNMGNMIKPVTVHSSAQLPGYAFPSMGAAQQRLILSPDMQARLPWNVVHLVSAGGQHHLISQPAQVALIQAMAQQQSGQPSIGIQAVTGPHVVSPSTVSVPSPGITLPLATTQVTSSMMNSPGVVKIVVRQAPKDGIPPTAVQPPRPIPQPAAGIQSSVAPAQRMTLPNPLGMSAAQPHLPARPPVMSPAQIQNPVIPTAPVRPMIRAHQPPVATVEQQAAAVTPPPALSSSPVPAVAATSTFSTSSTACLATTKPVITPSSTVIKEEPDTLMLRTVNTTPPPSPSVPPPRPRRQPPPPPRTPFYLESLEEKKRKQKEERLDRIFRINERHCTAVPMYGTEILHLCKMFSFPSQKEDCIHESTFWSSCGYAHCCASQICEKVDFTASVWTRTEALTRAIHSPLDRLKELDGIIERFIFAMPPVEAPPITMHASHPPPSLMHSEAMFKKTLHQQLSKRTDSLHQIICNMRTQFPDRRLIQYDCGKLQTLDILLRQLKMGGHRVLIFTQMTRMLDVLEQFLNFHGHIYLRLDGTTRVDQRQALMDRFNADKRIFCFILSTRSGGVGVNLTGADTVVFYDSDWNPTMDAQAQDRCHRIGQTRDVHIYRLISERTVEENILKKANQKRMLGDVAIEGGNFTTAYFKQQTIRELFDMPLDEPGKKETVLESPTKPPQRHNEKEEEEVEEEEDEENSASVKQTQILEQALCKAEDEEDIQAASLAKAEQVAELAEFNENIPLDMEDGTKEEEEELSKVELEIAALVEQLTPIERYAMNFLEASLEDISKEQLKQAEEEVEAARKDLDQAKDEVLKLPDDDEESRMSEEVHIKKRKSKSVRNMNERPGTRVSERLRGAKPKEAEKMESNTDDQLNTCISKGSEQTHITGEVQSSNKRDGSQKDKTTPETVHLKDAVQNDGSQKGPAYPWEQRGIYQIITGTAQVQFTGKNKSSEPQEKEEMSVAQVVKSDASSASVNLCSSSNPSVENSFNQETESSQTDAPQSSSVACGVGHISCGSHQLQVPLEEPLGKPMLPENLAEKPELTNDIEIERDDLSQPLSCTFSESVPSQVTVTLTEGRHSLAEKRAPLAAVKILQEARDVPITKGVCNKVETSSDWSTKMVSDKVKTLCENVSGFSSDDVRATLDRNIQATPNIERQIPPNENPDNLLSKGEKVTSLPDNGRTLSDNDQSLPFESGNTPVKVHSNLEMLDKAMSVALEHPLSPAVNICTETSHSRHPAMEDMEMTNRSACEDRLSRKSEMVSDDAPKHNQETHHSDSVEHFSGIPNRTINTGGGKHSQVSEWKGCSVFSNEKLLKNIVLTFQSSEVKHHPPDQTEVPPTVAQSSNKDKPLMEQVISETVQRAFGGHVEISSHQCTGTSLHLQFPEALQKDQVSFSVIESVAQGLCKENTVVLTEKLCKEDKALILCDVSSEGHKNMDTLQKELSLGDVQKKILENVKLSELSMSDENRQVNMAETCGLTVNKQLNSDSKDGMFKLHDKTNRNSITGVPVGGACKLGRPAEHQIFRSFSEASDQVTTVNRLQLEKELSQYSLLASSQIHPEVGKESELSKDSTVQHIVEARNVESDESNTLIHNIKTEVNEPGSLKYNSTLNEGSRILKCNTDESGEIVKSLPFESESEPHSFMMSGSCSSYQGDDQVAVSEEYTAVLKSPRRRTTADGEIRQSQSDGDSPSAKVLRKLPGRIITVVEERKPARCKRKRMEKEGFADQFVKIDSALNSSNSPSDNETHDGQKTVQRNLLAARRKIELEAAVASGLSEIDFQPEVQTPEVDEKDCCPVSETPAMEISLLRNVSSRRRVEVEARMATLFTSERSVPQFGLNVTETGKDDSPDRLTAEHKSEKNSSIVSEVQSGSFQTVEQGLEKASHLASPEALQGIPTQPDTQDETTHEAPCAMAESGTEVSSIKVSGDQAPVQKRKRGRPPKINRAASNSLLSRKDTAVDNTITSKSSARFKNENSKADVNTSSVEKFFQQMSNQPGNVGANTGEDSTKKIRHEDETIVDLGAHIEDLTQTEKKADSELVFQIQKRKRGRPRKIQKDEHTLPGSVKRPSFGVVKKPDKLGDPVLVQTDTKTEEISKQNSQAVAVPIVNYARTEREDQPCIQKRKRGRPRLVQSPVATFERSESELLSESSSAEEMSPKLQTEACLKKRKMQLNQSTRLTRLKCASLNRSQDQSPESDSEMSSDDYSKPLTRSAKQKDGTLDSNIKDKDLESETSLKIIGHNIKSASTAEPCSTFSSRVKHIQNPKESVKSAKHAFSPKSEPVKCETSSMDSSTTVMQSTRCKEASKQKPSSPTPQPQDTTPVTKYDETSVVSSPQMSPRYDCSLEFKSMCVSPAIKSSNMLCADSSASESRSPDCKSAVKQKTPLVNPRTKSTPPVEKCSDASSFCSKSEKNKQTGDEIVFCSKPKAKSEASALRAVSCVHQSASERRSQKLKVETRQKNVSPEHKVECSTKADLSKMYTVCTPARYPKRSEVDRQISLFDETRSTIVTAESELTDRSSDVKILTHKESAKRKILAPKLLSRSTVQAVKSCDALPSEDRASETSSPKHKETVQHNPLFLELNAVATPVKLKTLSNCSASEIMHPNSTEIVKPKSFPSKLKTKSVSEPPRDASSVDSSASDAKSTAHRASNKPKSSSQNHKKNVITPFLKLPTSFTADSASQRGSSRCKDVIKQKQCVPKPKRKTVTPLAKCVNDALDSSSCTKSLKDKEADKQNFSSEPEIDTPTLGKSSAVEIVKQKASSSKFETNSSPLANKSESPLVDSVSEARFLKCKQAVKQTSSLKHKAKSKDSVMKPNPVSVEKCALQKGSAEVRDSLRQKGCSRLKSANRFLSAALETDDTSSVDSSMSEVCSESHKEANAEKKPVSKRAGKTENRATKSDDASSADSSVSGQRNTPKPKHFSPKTKLRKLIPSLKSYAYSLEGTSEVNSPKCLEAVSPRIERKGLPAPVRSDEASSADSASERESSKLGERATANRSTRQKPGTLVSPLKSEKQILKIQKEQTSAINEIIKLRTKAVSSELEDSETESNSEEDDRRSVKRYREDSDHESSKRQKIELTERSDIKKSTCCSSVEGTPDRMLRSVAAAAAAAATTPANNTRSSASSAAAVLVSSTSSVARKGGGGGGSILCSTTGNRGRKPKT